MHRCNHLARTLMFALPTVLLPEPGRADYVSGSDGSDGAFNPQFKTVIDLSLAATASWDTASPILGQGVYDPEQWAVVFKYTTINIPADVTVSFLNHPSGAPVIWLATADVTISGTLSLDGEDGATGAQPMSYAKPGPGGFAGGVRGFDLNIVQPSSGFGPGVSGVGNGGNYFYGNVQIVPLIGGSGGGAYIGGGGGAGGGAILIASSTQIDLNLGSLISARGGSALGSSNPKGGSGGAIRLISDGVSGDGLLRAIGGVNFGSTGRIRIDAENIGLTDLGDPPWMTDFSPFPVFPASNVPRLRIVSVDGQVVPDDPAAGITTLETEIDNANPIVVNIEAQYIPSGTTVGVHVIPARGNPFSVTSTPLAVAGGGILTATAGVTLPTGRSEIHLKANWTP